jgi:ATP adenylyltransferase
MAYVGGSTREPGCVFCNRLASDADTEHLVVHRGAHVFAMLNRYPYNTGHLMVAPRQHVASPEDLSDDALTELMQLTRGMIRALRRTLSCDGFNVGFNVGAVAGAGIADHVHQHIVPRWVGDANFMPILAGTMVIPELLPVTYAKVRAEFARQEKPELPCALVCFDTTLQLVAVERASEGFRLPTVSADQETPFWKAAEALLQRVAANARLVTWAGTDPANRRKRSALGYVASGAGEQTDLTFQSLDNAAVTLSNEDGQLVRLTLDRLQADDS